METFTKHYKWPAVFLVLAVIAGGILGYFEGGNLVSAGLSAAFTVAVLSILETSLSFDNAVLNASELENMDDKHRHWFASWGILIAVFGMRLIFPVLIVSAVGSMTPWHAFAIALDNPHQYSTILESSSAYVSAFGGAFLMMVSLSFFLNKEKEEHWITWVESPLTKLAQLEVVITILTVIGTSLEVADAQRATYITAGVLGVALYLAVQALKDVLTEYGKTATAVVSGGIASLIYLEILDASMSFDGVIGAFAVTTAIFIVMLGLGVGASFVRGMTLHLVEKKALATFRYLEHGAQWAIGILAAIMFFKVTHTVPEAVTGLASAFIIAAAVYHSHIMNKRDEANPEVIEAETAA